jgi:hypothetical protein
MDRRIFLSTLVIVAAALCSGSAIAQIPTAVAAPGEKTIATFQGVAAQIYECKAGSDNNLAWSFRDPIAALIDDGKTVGRHYGGPTWEDVDGSEIVGKPVGNSRAPRQKIFLGSSFTWLNIRAADYSPA